MCKKLGLSATCLLLAEVLVSCSPPTGKPLEQYSPASAPPPSLVAPEGPPPVVVASRMIVVDTTGGQVLASKNADERCAVASTQKLLTALLVAEAGSLHDRVVIKPSDTEVEPTKLYLTPGHAYTRAALLKAILIRSANDASMALARDVAGSVSNFTSLMNKRARSLGMSSSAFRNPHGLTEEGQYSTARDIARLALFVYQNPVIRSSMTIPEYNFVHGDGKVTRLANTNKLLGKLPYVTGMKTGTTLKSGRCLVSSGNLHGRSVIVVVLGSTSRAVWDDSESLLRWALESPQVIKRPSRLNQIN